MSGLNPDDVEKEIYVDVSNIITDINFVHLFNDRLLNLTMEVKKKIHWIIYGFTENCLPM